mmetsp:Transcript_21267/g.54255  ORF Transcript_21267/g.54255 Transcript_21267/m.54255 type:complete len:110 (-) Transcript_21267:180-509(-)
MQCVRLSLSDLPLSVLRVLSPTGFEHKCLGGERITAARHSLLALPTSGALAASIRFLVQLWLYLDIACHFLWFDIFGTLQEQPCCLLNKASDLFGQIQPRLCCRSNAFA